MTPETDEDYSAELVIKRVVDNMIQDANYLADKAISAVAAVFVLHGFESRLARIIHRAADRLSMGAGRDAILRGVEDADIGV
jgi:hypothetical protein